MYVRKESAMLHEESRELIVRFKEMVAECDNVVFFGGWLALRLMWVVVVDELDALLL